MLGLELLKEWLERPEELWNQAVPQGKGEYWEKTGDQDRTITPVMSAENANRLARAYSNQTILIQTKDDLWFVRDAIFHFAGGKILMSGIYRRSVLFASP